MSEISNQPGAAQGEELDDFDVEAHGLKEVALGLSAATIMAGGAGAAALALDNPAPGTTAGAKAAVSGVQSDLDKRLTWAQGVTTDALHQVRDTVDDVQQLSDRTTEYAVTTSQQTAEHVVTTVRPVVDYVDTTGAEAVALADRVVNDPIGETDRLVDQTIATARSVRDDAIATAHEAAQTASDTAASAQATAEHTVQEVQSTVDPQAEVRTGSGSTTVTASAAGTTVTVTVD